VIIGHCSNILEVIDRQAS